jgi:hypothetical protein
MQILAFSKLTARPAAQRAASAPCILLGISPSHQPRGSRSPSQCSLRSSPALSGRLSSDTASRCAAGVGSSTGSWSLRGRRVRKMKGQHTFYVAPQHSLKSKDGFFCTQPARRAELQHAMHNRSPLHCQLAVVGPADQHNSHCRRDCFAHRQQCQHCVCRCTALRCCCCHALPGQWSIACVALQQGAGNITI